VSTTLLPSWTRCRGSPFPRPPPRAIAQPKANSTDMSLRKVKTLGAEVSLWFVRVGSRENPERATFAASRCHLRCSEAPGASTNLEYGRGGGSFGWRHGACVFSHRNIASDGAEGGYMCAQSRGGDSVVVDTGGFLRVRSTYHSGNKQGPFNRQSLHVPAHPKAIAAAV